MRCRLSRFFRVWITAAAGALCIFFSSVLLMSRAAPLAGAQTTEQGALRRQAWLVPASQAGILMRTTVFRPPGPGPFPLVVINHGTTQNAERRRLLQAPDFDAMAQWFVRHGFAVAVPQRPGHGETGGDFREDQGSCDEP